jgi:hypothetical protein
MGQVLQSFGPETTELGGSISRDGIISGLRGTTRQADRIADAITSGRIRMEIVDDATFAGPSVGGPSALR